MIAWVTRFLGALWNVAGLLVLLVLFIEFGLPGLRRLSRRLRHRRPAPPDERALADAYRGALWPHTHFAEYAGGVRLLWAPFVEWWQRPYTGSEITIDSRGLRPTPGETTAGAAAARIFCFGGSTMVGVGARDAWTIPAVLQRRLDEAGCRVSVTNFGQLGYNSSQEVMALQRLALRGEVPQVALFLDGFNDLWSAEWAGRADTILSADQRQAEFNLLHQDRRRDLVAAAIVAALPRTLRYLRRWAGLALRGPVPPAAGAALEEERVPALAKAVVETYAANLRLARLIGREYGFAVLFFWQPLITSKKSKTAYEQRAEAHLAANLATRRRLFSAAIEERRRHRDLAGAADAVDLSALFDDQIEPVYIDFGHLSEAGNAAVAEAMLPAVMKAIGAPRS